MTLVFCSMSKSISDIPIEKLFKGRINGRNVLSLNESIAGSSNESGIFVETNGGRHLITIEEYIQRLKLEKPAVVIAMADEVPYSCGKRKLSTAVKRTQSWFDKLRTADIHWDTCILVGVVVGNKISEDGSPDSISAQTSFLLQGGAQGMRR